MKRVDLLNELLDFAQRSDLLRAEDRSYAFNRVLAALQLLSPDDAPDTEFKLDPDLPEPARYLEPLLDDAVTRQIVEDYTQERDLLDARIMDALMPLPSAIIDHFQALKQSSPEQATDWYYKLAQDSHYIRRDRIRKDKRWKHDTPYGVLDMTINLSKPEKDPRAIAAARNTQAIGYPLCALCREAEGYDGHANYAGRANHRIIPLDLAGTPYYLQYSPYVYYNEHCIVLNEDHIPMSINRDTFARLAAFVHTLPHYFVGSNADLPIVGGSILSHDHYQGGRYVFAMEVASALETFLIPGYTHTDVSILNWPMSVLRLRAQSTEPAHEDELLDLADHILSTWRNYSDPAADILHTSDGDPHNTVTPICRLQDGHLELDLVLRNNRTSDEHPLGIFHPHAERHHIKRENIGLIEVMGLAVLPARLLTELEACAESLFTGQDLHDNPLTAAHAHWCDALQDQGSFDGAETQDAILSRLDAATGDVFLQVLEDAGVYKLTEEGQAAFRRFIAFLG